MKGYFIYVFNKEDRDFLLSAGCTLALSDDKNLLYAFLNNDNASELIKHVEHIISNTLVL